MLERVTRECAISTLPSTFGSGEAELVALVSGLKPVVRQQLRDDALEAQRARVESVGVHAVLGARVQDVTRVYLSRDEAQARAALDAETRGDDAALGTLLGYPACCVRAFTSLPEHWLPRLRWGKRRTNLALARAAARRTTTFHGRLNSLDLHLFHYLAWTPCSYDCAPSLAYADAVAAELSRRPRGWSGPVENDGARAFVERVDVLLGARRVVWKAAHVSFTVDEHGAVTDAWPTSRDHARRVVTREQLEREVVLAAFLVTNRDAKRFEVFPFSASEGVRPSTR